MPWTVRFADEFETEWMALPDGVQDKAMAVFGLLAEFGPSLGRPRVDTLKASRHANMKELRFDADGGVWRVAFAFDPVREAILLVAGDKAGADERRFYADLIAKADMRFDRHLACLKKDK
ncbi:MAG: type II toxin-antitoxin system RelE/ParE family toxin [Alphaproteobacteria bacterium]|nr:type II toxin-antitoxin system RelE/ParE family toxin [Alphaproteobacteria bacterium]